jgi:hypothetical protein
VNRLKDETGFAINIADIEGSKIGEEAAKAELTAMVNGMENEKDLTADLDVKSDTSSRISDPCRASTILHWFLSKYVYINIAKNDDIIVHGSLSYPKRIRIARLLLTYNLLAPNIFTNDAWQVQAIVDLIRAKVAEYFG